MTKDGIPVIDIGFDSNGDSENTENDNGNCDCGCQHEDDIVEFGYTNNTPVKPLEDSDVVEF